MHGRLMICEEYVSVTQGSPCQCDADSTICDVCQNDARMPVQLYSMWRGKSVWCKEANITMYVKTVCQRNARKARYNRVFQRNARKARCNCVWRLSIKMYGSLLCDDCISAWRMENYMIFCEDMSARCREDCTIIICEDYVSVMQRRQCNCKTQVSVMQGRLQDCSFYFCVPFAMLNCQVRYMNI